MLRFTTLITSAKSLLLCKVTGLGKLDMDALAGVKLIVQPTSHGPQGPV